MFSKDASDAAVLEDVSKNKADVVLLQPWKQLTEQRCTSLVERLKQSGLEPVSREALPAAGHDFSILVRANRLELVQETTDRR